MIIGKNIGKNNEGGIRLNLTAREKSKKGKQKMSRMEKRFFRIGLLFVSPWIIGFLCFQIFPICSALYYSFTDYNVFQPAKWVGLKNYIQLFKNDLFYKSLQNTLYVTVIGLPLGLVVSLSLATLLNQQAKGLRVFRTLFYLPTVVPVVASAMLFLWVLNPEYGLLNNLLSLLGIKGPSWLSDPNYTKLSLLIMDVWRCGQTMIIFLSALKAVPPSLYEAAQLDGAGPVKRFFKITLPYISPTIQFNMIMGLIGYFQYFTQAFVFASVSQQQQTITGGPKNSLLFYSLYLYQQGFSYLKMGYASAMAIILFVIVMIVSFFALRISEKRVNYDVE